MRKIDEAMNSLNTVVAKVIGESVGKRPAWQYGEVYVSDKRRYLYGWTTERREGVFQSFVYKPLYDNKGETWELTKVRKFKKRISAKNNALRKMNAHRNRLERYKAGVGEAIINRA